MHMAVWPTRETGENPSGGSEQTPTANDNKARYYFTVTSLEKEKLE